MTRRRTRILGGLSLLLVVLGFLALTLGLVQVVAVLSSGRGILHSTSRIPVTILAAGAAFVTAGVTLEHWLRRRRHEGPRGFNVVSIQENGRHPAKGGQASFLQSHAVAKKRSLTPFLIARFQRGGKPPEDAHTQ